MHAQHAVPALQRPGFYGAEVGVAGGVEYAVDAAKLLVGAGHRIAYAVFAGHVHRQGDGTRQFGGYRIGAVGIHVEYRNAPAFVREAPRHRCRQAGTTAGGKQHFVFESAGHVFLSLSVQ